MTVGYLTASSHFVLHSANSTNGTDTIFAVGPAGARPVTGQWMAAGAAPSSLDNVPVEPPLHNPKTSTGFE